MTNRFHRFFKTVFMVIVLNFAIACGDEEQTIGGQMDASLGQSSSVDAGTSNVSLLIGTGDTGFEPIVENQTLPLILGPQGTGRIGGYHIFGGVRANGLDASQRVRLKFIIERTSDGLIVANSVWDKKLQPSVQGDEFYALTVILMDCCEVRGQSLRMQGSATDHLGQSGSMSIDILAGPTCADVEGREICP